MRDSNILTNTNTLVLQISCKFIQAYFSVSPAHSFSCEVFVCTTESINSTHTDTPRERVMGN